MEYKLTEKKIKVYNYLEETIEVEVKGQIIDFWYTKPEYGIKLYCFGVRISEADIEAYLEIALENGRNGWLERGIE